MCLQVFGKTLLCRTMDVAHLMAQEHKLNGVTIQGEHVDRKISYRGGFLDPSRWACRLLGQCTQVNAAVTCWMM